MKQLLIKLISIIICIIILPFITILFIFDWLFEGNTIINNYIEEKIKFNKK